MKNMKSKTVTKWMVAAISVFCAVGLMAQAQTQSGQGVARVSFIHGDVSTQRGDSGDTAAAALNAPLVTGDKISTGDNSRAELQMDFANILRLGNQSQANIASLTDKEIQIQISRGEATYTALKTSEIRPEVLTANLSVRPSKGDVSFRVDVVSADETEVSVRRGEAEVSTSSGSTQVRKGEMILVHGNGAEAQYKVESARDRDDWDKWNDDRDHLIENAEGVRHTSPYYTGTQDLDAYGRWRNVPDYGNVWEPAASSDWAPYREGHWVWEPGYGWTWVSYEPWGWAPYHYGRWFLYDSSWVWWPGPVGGYGYGYHDYYRPVWAPAYVSFFGFGGGVGIGFGGGFGSYGWLPIGPCDYYHPWYGGYGSRYNVVNVTNITNVYNYRDRDERGERPLYRGRGVQYSNLQLAGREPRIRSAITSVPANRFGSAGVITRGVDENTFRGGHMMTANLPVVPTRESLRTSDRPASHGAFGGSQPQRFFGNRAPASSPHPFEQQAAQVQQSIQRDGHFTPVRSGEVAGNVSAGRGNINAGGANSGGFHSFGNQNAGNQNAGKPSAGIPGTSNQSPQRGGSTPRDLPPNPPARGADGGTQQGWHRFSGPSGPASTGAGRSDAAGVHDLPPNTGSGWQRGNQGAGRDLAPARSSQPTASRGGGNNVGGNGGGWQRFPSSSGGSARSSSNGTLNGSPNSAANNVRPYDGGPGTGNRGWDRGPSPNSGRSEGGHSAVGRSESPVYRGSSPGGDYGRGGGGGSYSRPTLDMRQPVVTPRSSGPAYSAPRGGGGGGGRSESPRPSGGGGGARPSGGGGGHSGGGARSSGGGRPR